MAEILATTDEINAELPSQDEDPVIEATIENTELIQLSVARVVRAYLSSVATSTVLMSWDSPANTPDTIREIAAMLIAAQLYLSFSGRTVVTIEERNYAQVLYDRAIGMLNQVVAGTIVVPGVGLGGGGSIVTLDMDPEDGFPIDDTDRAFTLSMEL